MDSIVTFMTPEREYSFLLRARRRRRNGYRVEVYILTDHEGGAERGDVPIRVFNGHSLCAVMGRSVSYLVEVYGLAHIVDAGAD